VTPGSEWWRATLSEQRFEWTDIRAEEGLSREAERAVLMGLDRGDGTFTRTFAEMDELARNAWLTPVASVSQKAPRPHPSTYLGKGKVEEVRELLEIHDATVVVTSDPLKPAQQRNLERILETPVIDRTEVILDIFAHRARSREGKVQVELAQLEYRLPRLSGHGEMLSRLGAGIGTRGPGETKLETDRRRVRNRLSRLKEEMKEIGERRRRERARSADGPFRIALVGYTNAGKSTLLNRLTNADVYVDDRLFATLDPTTRGLELEGGRRILLTDTVGFIDHLPTSLIAAFSATLEEAREADLLLHVVDASDPQAAEKIDSVIETLDEIHALDVPIVTVLNKCDRESGPESDLLPAADGEDVIRISALSGMGVEALSRSIERQADQHDPQVAALVPFAEMALLGQIHERGTLIEEEYREDGVWIVARVPQDLRGKLEAYTTAP
jgi:GTPase